MLVETIMTAMEEIAPTRATAVEEILIVRTPAKETRLETRTRTCLVDPGQPEEILLETIGLANGRLADAMPLMTKLVMTQQS